MSRAYKSYILLIKLFKLNQTLCETYELINLYSILLVDAVSVALVLLRRRVQHNILTGLSVSRPPDLNPGSTCKGVWVVEFSGRTPWVRAVRGWATWKVFEGGKSAGFPLGLKGSAVESQWLNLINRGRQGNGASSWQTNDFRFALRANGKRVYVWCKRFVKRFDFHD